MGWIDYYKEVLEEGKKGVYDAVSKRADMITDAVQYLGDKEHSIVTRALAEILMLVDAGIKKEGTK